MPASRDSSQKIAFYFGNAARDLNHLLPADEASHSACVDILERQEQIDNLHQILDSVQSHLTEVQKSRRQISYLLSDLRRMLG